MTSSRRRRAGGVREHPVETGDSLACAAHQVPPDFADYAVSIDDAALPAGVSLQRQVG